MASQKKIDTYKGFDLMIYNRVMIIFKDGEKYSSIAVSSKKAFKNIIDTYLQSLEK